MTQNLQAHIRWFPNRSNIKWFLNTKPTCRSLSGDSQTQNPTGSPSFPNTKPTGPYQVIPKHKNLQVHHHSPTQNLQVHIRWFPNTKPTGQYQMIPNYKTYRTISDDSQIQNLQDHIRWFPNTKPTEPYQMIPKYKTYRTISGDSQTQNLQDHIRWFPNTKEQVQHYMIPKHQTSHVQYQPLPNYLNHRYTIKRFPNHKTYMFLPADSQLWTAKVHYQVISQVCHLQVYGHVTDK